MIRHVLATRAHVDDTAPHDPGEPLAATEASIFPGAPGAIWSVAESFAWCERMVRSKYDTFPVASRFLPAELRPYVCAIYAFARSADRIAEDPRYAGHREAAFDDWEDRLERAYHGEAEHPIFVAIRETAERRDVPITPFRDVITAFRIDSGTRRYPTFEALRRYTQHCAVSVGQLVLYVFDYRDPALLRYADDFATGVALAHFLRDLPHDLGRDRIYIPQEDLNHFGVAEEDLLDGQADRAFRDLMRFQVARARALLQRGRPLGDLVGRDLGFEVNLIWNGAMTLLDQIERGDCDVFRFRPALGPIDKLRMAVKSAARRWPAFSTR
jgi:squalene synthase HpnC